MVNNCRNPFDMQFQRILRSGSPEGRSILRFVERSLAQFNLSGNYNSVDVLHEAYVRGIKLISTGKRIDNPLAWIRATSYNIIRELSRECKKVLPLTESWVEDEVDQNLVSHEELLSDFERVNLAFKKLGKEDRKILQLKIIQNLSWRNIIHSLEQEGSLVEKESTLRKRKQRALIELRKIYYSLNKVDTISNELP